jgi:Glycosyl hydrolase family 76
VEAATLAHTYADRAIKAYNAMQRSMYIPGTSLYRETAPQTGNPYSYLWPFSRALIGTLALAGMPRSLGGGARYQAAVLDRVTGLTKYWDSCATPPAYDSYVPVPPAPGGDKYYDDNAWVSLALIQQYRMGLTASLDRPKRLFSFAQAGWDHIATDPNPGGVFWVQQDVGYGLSNHDRGAGASAGSAEVAFHLHELTGQASYDGDGQVTSEPGSVGGLNMVNWVSKYLDSSGTGSGPFLNVVRRDGSIDTNVWSYNEGVMIGARVLQYRLTKQHAALQLAEATARQALATFGDFTGQPPSFNAMCFQNMLMLHAVSADATLKATIVQAMQRYADWTWAQTTGARDGSNLFHFTDGGQPAPVAQPARLQDQGAMVQVNALLAWNASDYGKLT